MLESDFIAEAYNPVISDGRARFPETVRASAPKGMSNAIATAAEMENTSQAEFVRRAILTSLEAKGVRLRRGMVVVGQMA